MENQRAKLYVVFVMKSQHFKATIELAVYLKVPYNESIDIHKLRLESREDSKVAVKNHDLDSIVEQRSCRKISSENQSCSSSSFRKQLSLRSYSNEGATANTFEVSGTRRASFSLVPNCGSDRGTRH
ncbi:hypothetical protein V1477_010807 [Vespula maculifrons]|uniref:Uncharacterized protein n=1 Tax=Vespula maculifrons TaxID=7453 RepID=A0ABD2C304_VESMC